MPPKKLEQNTNKNESSAELPEEAIDFKSSLAAKVLYEDLMRKRKTVEEGLVLDLGKIETTASSGRVFEVEALWWPKNKSRPLELQESSLKLITIDKKTRKLAGIRNIMFQKYDEEDEEQPGVVEIAAEGDITSRYRGVGVASATDSALVQTLEKIASRYSTDKIEYRINWRIADGLGFNLENEEFVLEQLEENTKMSEKERLAKIAETKKNIERYTEEYKHWQTLYGPNGKFGFREERDKFSAATHTQITIRGKSLSETDIPTKISPQKFDLLIEKVRQAK